MENNTNNIINKENTNTSDSNINPKSTTNLNNWYLINILSFSLSFIILKSGNMAINYFDDIIENNAIQMVFLYPLVFLLLGIQALLLYIVVSVFEYISIIKVLKHKKSTFFVLIALVEIFTSICYFYLQTKAWYF